jgi:hypothetical protein
MDIDSHLHIVDYETYCATCKHRDDDAFLDPCNDCLNEPVNADSKKPVYWSERDDSSKS